MKRLPRLTQGGMLTPAQWELAARVIEDNFREVTIQPGVGYRSQRGPGGTTLQIKGGGGGAIPAPFKPLEIILSSITTPEGVTTHYLSLYPGTVDGIYPKVAGDFLWQMPSDGHGGFLEYPRQEITLPDPGSILNVWLTCTSVAGRITEVVCDTGATVPADTAGTAHVLLGFIRADQSISQSAFGPLAYQLVFGIYDNTWSHSFTFAP